MVPVLVLVLVRTLLNGGWVRCMHPTLTECDRELYRFMRVSAVSLLAVCWSKRGGVKTRRVIY